MPAFEPAGSGWGGAVLAIDRRGGASSILSAGLVSGAGSGLLMTVILSYNNSLVKGFGQKNNPYYRGFRT